MLANVFSDFFRIFVSNTILIPFMKVLLLSISRFKNIKEQLSKYLKHNKSECRIRHLYSVCIQLLKITFIFVDNFFNLGRYISIETCQLKINQILLVFLICTQGQEI